MKIISVCIQRIFLLWNCLLSLYEVIWSYSHTQTQLQHYTYTTHCKDHLGLEQFGNNELFWFPGDTTRGLAGNIAYKQRSTVCKKKLQIQVFVSVRRVSEWVSECKTNTYVLRTSTHSRRPDAAARWSGVFWDCMCSGKNLCTDH